jgi:hypothetical protein
MSADFKFMVVDASEAIEAQQNIVRDLVAARVNLANYVMYQRYQKS